MLHDLIMLCVVSGIRCSTNKEMAGEEGGDGAVQNAGEGGDR